MSVRPAPTNGFFAQSSEPLSSALSSTTEDIQAFTVDDDDAPIAASDKYYVPRAKDVKKKQREREGREKREREERERKAGGRHKVKEVGLAKEELDFSDDEDDELDGLGGAVRDSKPKARTQPKQKEEHQEEEKEGREEEEEKQQQPRITVVTHKPAATSSSQPTILTRTGGGTGSEQKKEEMSDEEEDDLEANTKLRKQPTLAQRMSDEDQSSPRTSHTSVPSSATAATANVAPLINPVALSFFLRRLALTAAGGLQLSFSPSRPPALMYVLSIASFVVAPLLVLIFSLIDHASVLPSGASVYVAGLVAAVLHCAAHVPSLRQPVPSSEEWSTASTFTSLFPTPAAGSSKAAMMLLAVNCCLYGVLVALSTSALSFSTSSGVFHSASPLFLLLAYCCLALCLYPLVRSAPVEPNQYRADTTLLPSYTRPLYVLLLLVPCVVSAVPDGVRLALLLCLLFVPLLCTAGVLSEPTVLLLWFIEQCNILLYGGHVSSADHRTAVAFAASVAATAAIAALRCLSTSPAVLSSIAAAVLLSHCFLLHPSLLTVLAREIEK